MNLFLLFQTPLLLFGCCFGSCSLWRSAEYNLAGITAWCLFRRYFWKEAANCMACSVFCTFVVWALALLPELLLLVAQATGIMAP